MKRVYKSSDIAHRDMNAGKPNQFLMLPRVTSGHWKNSYFQMNFLIIFLSVIFFSGTLTAQEADKDVKTEKIMVNGACSMCKKRIEKAAYVKGVKRAEWSKDAQELTVTYKPSKTSTDEILKSVAAAGHDSEKFTAPKEAYSKLPECCNYRTGTCHD